MKDLLLCIIVPVFNRASLAWNDTENKMPMAGKLEMAIQTGIMMGKSALYSALWSRMWGTAYTAAVWDDIQKRAEA